MGTERDWKDMRDRIIGLGEESSRKSFYPQLQQRLSQLELAREELRRSETNLRTVFEALPDAVFICDTRWRVLEVNEAALTMFGLDRAAFEGYSPFEFTDWGGHEDPEESFRRAQERLRRERQLRLEWTARRPKDGSTFEVEGSFRLAQWYDQEAFVAILRDVTGRKHLEALLRQSQKLDALGQLAGGMAHDTNNMLGVILGYVDLLEEQVAADPGCLEDLAQVRKAALRSSELIRQLLAFARKQTIQPRVVDLNTLVEDTQRMLRRLIGEHIALVWKPATVLGPVWVDPSQIDQVLANLVVNARDAIEGGGTITLETRSLEVDEAFCQSHPDASPGRYACLAVSDTGRGMTPEVKARIFDPFFTTKEAGRGTGLGLATVYGILRQNCGFISVYSEPGLGTTFRLCFPQHATAAEPVRAEPAGGPPPGGTETILLVEDEEALLGLQQSILEGVGYRVIPAASPRAALELAGEDLDLLVTDLVMPGMSGLELHEALARSRPLPVLFMSGYPAEVARFGEALGKGRAFLAKPFTRAEFLALVRQVLDGQG